MFAPFSMNIYDPTEIQLSDKNYINGLDVSSEIQPHLDRLLVLNKVETRSPSGNTLLPLGRSAFPTYRFFPTPNNLNGQFTRISPHLSLFHQFRHLPLEIRLKIWEFYLAGNAKNVIFTRAWKNNSRGRSTELPVIMRIDKQTRTEALKYLNFHSIKEETRQHRGVLFHTHSDMLFLDPLENHGWGYAWNKEGRDKKFIECCDVKKIRCIALRFLLADNLVFRNRFEKSMDFIRSFSIYTKLELIFIVIGYDKPVTRQEWENVARPGDEILFVAADQRLAQSGYKGFMAGVKFRNHIMKELVGATNTKLPHLVFVHGIRPDYINGVR